MAAQKSRQKKKEYVTELEERLSFLEAELHFQKIKPQGGNLESKIENLKAKEKEYLNYFTSTSGYTNGKVIEEKKEK